jgi:hypothetical protein
VDARVETRRLARSELSGVGEIDRGREQDPAGAAIGGPAWSTVTTSVKIV